MAEQESIKEIKSVLKTDKVVMGTEETIKELKQNKISTVYLSSNVAENVENDINYYSEIAGAEVVKLSVPNDELGVMCQKPYYVAVLGIRK